MLKNELFNEGLEKLKKRGLYISLLIKVLQKPNTGWLLPIVFIDIAWGAVLSSLVSFAGFQIVKWIN